MRYNNCLFWALYRRIRYGGTLRWSKSVTWWGFHVTWVDPVTLQEWEYTVLDRSVRAWYYTPILYRGVVVRKIR